MQSPLTTTCPDCFGVKTKQAVRCRTCRWSQKITPTIYPKLYEVI